MQVGSNDAEYRVTTPENKREAKLVASGSITRLDASHFGPLPSSLFKWVRFTCSVPSIVVEVRAHDHHAVVYAHTSEQIATSCITGCQLRDLLPVAAATLKEIRRAGIPSMAILRRAPTAIVSPLTDTVRPNSSPGVASPADNTAA